MDELQALLRAVGEDESVRPILADWLEERGIDRDEAIAVMPLRPFDLYSFGFLDDGSGIGSGIGSGSIYMETGKAYLVHCGDWSTVATGTRLSAVWSGALAPMCI